MKLAATRAPGWFYVDWWLMNHCSWQCSYCHEQLRNGSINIVGVKDCLRFIESVTDYAEKKSQKVDFNFTGGEVTEWNEFPSLVKRAHDLGNTVRFRSNANCDTATWKQLIAYAHSVTMDLHPEHTSVSKFMLALDYSVSAGVSVVVNANMLKDRWDDLIKITEKIKEKYPMVTVNSKMLFEDPIFNTQPLDYDDQQITMIKRQSGDLVLTDADGNEDFTDYQTLILEDKNRFKGWKCSVGLEQIIVDAWGRVYRGHCRMGGKLGEITDDQIQWPLSDISCQSDVCRNGFDIQATKSL